MAHTYKINFKEALLEPEDWESLIHEKEYKISLTKSQDTIPQGQSSLTIGEAYGFELLRRRLDGVLEVTSGVLKAVVAYADRQNAEIQARTVLGRLRVASASAGCQYVGDVRMELLRLHRMALKGKYSVSTRTKIAQTRIHWVSTYLKARPDPVDSVVYKDLIELLSLVCTDEYPGTLLHEIWSVFLEELRSNGDARPMASALVQCDAGDVHLILRHLAASYVLAWSTIPSGQYAIHSETDARKAAQKLAFAWNTYDSYRRATEGFHRLIHGVLLESPSLVHAAFDDTRLHLLWLKFLPPNSKALSYGRILDSAVAPFLTYPKYLRPDLPLELQCLVLFIATREPGKLAVEGATHITTTVASFRRPADIRGVYTNHPALVSGELAHPALPFFLFAAELFKHSEPAAEAAINGGIVETIFSLWRAEFALIGGRSTGQYVRPEKRIKAMRLASTLAFSGLATHTSLHSALAKRKVNAKDEDQQTFWDVVAFALSVERADEKWGVGWCAGAVRGLAFWVMREWGRFPGDVNLVAAVANANNIAWMLQSSGDPTVDARIRSFALDVLLAQIMAPSADWKYAVAILCQCQAHEQEALKATLSEFVDHFLHSSKTRIGSPDKDKRTPNSRPTSTNLLIDTSIPGESPTSFMRDPLDRFVMFISNATRTNTHVASAVAKSAVLQLVRLLMAGRFEATDVVPGSSTKEWRRRTCMEILQQRRIRALVVVPEAEGWFADE